MPRAHASVSGLRTGNERNGEAGTDASFKTWWCNAHDDMMKCNTQANDKAATANNWGTPGTSVSGRHTIIPCLFYSFGPFQYREDIYAHPCFQAFPKQFTDDYLSNHLYGQEARKVFIQHPRFNIEVFLKRMKDGRSIIHMQWPKVAKTFNVNEGSMFAFHFSSFPDEIHLSMYHLSYIY